jgi:hypothetical protein
MVNKTKLFLFLIFICFAVLIAFVGAEIFSNNSSDENQSSNESFGVLNNPLDLNNSLGKENLSIAPVENNFPIDSTYTADDSLGNPSHMGGGSPVPVSDIDLSNQNGNYNMKPGRLKFDFEGNIYAIQIRRVKENYVDFLVLKLDSADKEEDVTAYRLDNSFSLSPGQENEIDLNRDGIMDISIKLNGFSLAGKSGSIKSADFSIGKIK